MTIILRAGLGGRPPELFDQATDGVADVVWTPPGCTPAALRAPKCSSCLPW